MPSMRTLASIFLLVCVATAAAGGDALQRFLQVGDGRLFSESAGPAEAPAIVLLHDGLLPSSTWDDAAPLLARRFRVIRYDRRGMGRSDAPRSPFIPIEDLLAVLDSLAV